MSARKGWPALTECLLFSVKHHFLSSESLSEHLFAEPEHRLIDQALSDLSPLFFSELLFAIGELFLALWMKAGLKWLAQPILGRALIMDALHLMRKKRSAGSNIFSSKILALAISAED